MADYIVHVVRSAPDDLFGFKISWEQAARLSQALTREGIGVSGPDLRSVFPGLTYLHLVRQDKLAQAVSLWRARTTGRWHEPVGEVHSSDSALEIDDPAKDLGTMRKLFLQLVADDWLWHDFFDAAQIDAAVLTYEDYVKDRLTNLERIAKLVGGQPPTTAPVEKTAVMRDNRTNEMVDKLRALLHSPTSPWWVLSEP